MSYSSVKYNRGFTLIELMITIAIFSIIIGVMLQQGRSMNTTVELENASRNIDLKIKTAKSRSIGALNNTSYGVHFEASKVVIFDGSGLYVDGAASNEEFILPTGVEIYSISLAGGGTGSDIFFERLTGNTVNFGSVVLRSVRDTTRMKTIFINSNGQDSFSSFNISSGPAIANARHTHFNLNWDIGSSSQLILKWYDLSNNLILTKSISTSAYFNADKSRFNWESTISESGIDQTITINSWLDASNYTVLDVIRHNTEADKLEIYFDTEKIATYANIGGVITITPGSSVISTNEL
ncbi:MAG: prepilin-type N-terminal cleavage/methylation domain-containing protein [Candidatus Paceibacterota bacterium]